MGFSEPQFPHLQIPPYRTVGTWHIDHTRHLVAGLVKRRKFKVVVTRIKSTSTWRQIWRPKGESFMFHAKNFGVYP